MEENSRTREEAEKLWREALTLISVTTWEKRLYIEEFYAQFDPYAKESKTLVRLLSDTRQVWLFATSLGGDLERRSREYLKQHQTFRGFILDRIGSFLIEDVIKKMDKRITNDCKSRGLCATRRYSPGYRDFSIGAQRIFFEMIGGGMAGLELTDGYLLKPEKTITALKGMKQLIRGETTGGTSNTSADTYTNSSTSN